MFPGVINHTSMKRKKCFMRNKLLTGLSALMLSLSVTGLAANATELPSTVLNYLKQKDPNVKVRFDGLVLFSNGETYVPVIPQDPTLNAEPQQVIVSVPEKAQYPDLVEFDNHFFLLRLIQTASGRLTFPKMTEYPLQMKEGLLPQDFVMPSNLFIPVELKVILGALPYNPSFEAAPATPAKTPAAAVAPPAVTLAQVPAPKLKPLTQRQTYIFDLTEQKVLAIDAISGRRTGDIALDCVPSSLRLSSDGKLLFAPCLSTNELVVVDTGSNLVKTRVPVGQRPDAVLYLDQTQEVVVSNRYSPFLSVIDSNTLVQGERITLPGNGGAMTMVPKDAEGRIVVADAAKPQIYVVNVDTRQVEKTLKSLPNVSAMWVGWNANGQMELWTASRTEDQVQVLDPSTGNVIKTLDVGRKPVEFAAFGNKVYVVSAGGDRLDVIEKNSKQLLDAVTLPDGSFPASVVTMPSEKRAYVTTAGANNLIVVNLESGQVENTLPVEFRANMITMTPDTEEEAAVTSQEGPQGPAPVLQQLKPSIPAKVNPKNQPKTAGKKDKGFGLFSKKEQKPMKEASKKAVPAVQEKGPASKQVAYPQAPGMSSGPLPTQNGGGVTFKLGKDKPKTDAKKEEMEVIELGKETVGPQSKTATEGKPAAKSEAPPMIEEKISK